MSHGPSTLGTMITSRRSPIWDTSVVMSSSAQGDSSALTRVHNAALPRSISLPTRTRPARAASLFSTAMASSRLPRRTSAFVARSGSLPTIFALEGSKKWIIRAGVTGISSGGSGAPTARGLAKSRGFLMRRQLYKRGSRRSGAPAHVDLVRRQQAIAAYGVVAELARVGDDLDGEAGLAQPVGEVGAVDADVVWLEEGGAARLRVGDGRVLVGLRSARLHRRHDDGPAAGAQHAGHLAHRLAVVGDLGQHVPAEHGVEGAVPEGDVLDVEVQHGQGRVEVGGDVVDPGPITQVAGDGRLRGQVQQRAGEVDAVAQVQPQRAVALVGVAAGAAAEVPVPVGQEALEAPPAAGTFDSVAAPDERPQGAHRAVLGRR